MRRSRARLAAAHAVLPLALALLVGCGSPELPAVGDLNTPASLAVHLPSKRLFVASLGADELRVLDLRTNRFIVAPAVSFPLAVPTVDSPIGVAAGQRFVFVLSGADAAVGFVDTEVPPGAAGPRSVDNAEGRPVTVALDTVPTDMAALGLPGAAAGAAIDRLLVVGLSPDGSGGDLRVVAAPTGNEGPRLLTSLELPGIFPAAIALDPFPAGSEGAAEFLCSIVAIADNRWAEGHEAGIWMSRVRLTPDGEVEIDPFEEAGRISISVPVTLADGSVEERVAPVRKIAFAPAPADEALNEAVAAEPCALRSGRIFALLDPAYCGGAVECPNFAAVDLDGEGGSLAVDKVRGGPAAYQLPGAQLALAAFEGPITVSGALDPSQVENGTVQPAGRLSVLVLSTSTDGNLNYVAGGRGSHLRGPGPERRATAGPVFVLSAQREGPGLFTPILRVDIGRRLPPSAYPQITFPAEARPRDEGWTAQFEGPLPGFDRVGVHDDLEGDRLRVRSGLDLRSPLPILASDDPEEADRIVPIPTEEVVCEGYPIRSIAADGRSLQVDREAFDNPVECTAPANPLVILPPRARPWTLRGEVTGFVGRLAADPSQRSSVFVGPRLLFHFRPPEDAVERGATYEWSTTDGFEPFRFDAGSRGLLPAAIVPYRVSGDGNPVWQAWVGFSGADTLLGFNPARPNLSEALIFR